jgi:hypothetical protein
VSELKKDDIYMLAKKAAKEGNPVYPVPVLMDANELMQLYFDVLE